jgi:hypothetical protein
MSVTVETFDLSASPQTSVTITPPSGTWMTDIIFQGVGMSASNSIRLTIDGITTATYRKQFFVRGTDGVTNSSDLDIGNLVSATGLAGHVMIFGMGLVAPTPYIVRPISIGDTVPAIAMGWERGVSARSTIEVFSSGGASMNAGGIWALHHIRNHELIDTFNFGSPNQATSHAFTGLNKWNSLVLLGDTLTSSGGLDSLELNLSDDNGSTWDIGASDYAFGRMKDTIEAHGNSGAFMSTANASNTNDFISYIENFRTPVPTTNIISPSAYTANTSPNNWAGYRNNTERHNGIRIKSSGAAEYQTGILYLIGAK